jgi:hypothetical protein
MSTYRFLQDRKRGKPAQEKVAEILREKGYSVWVVNDGMFPDYDLRAEKEHIKFTAEIKYDIKAQETKNICLEIPALSHSKASILFIALGTPITEVLMLPLPSTLSYALKWPIKRVVGEHDELAALVPIASLRALDFVSTLWRDKVAINLY